MLARSFKSLALLALPTSLALAGCAADASTELAGAEAELTVAGTITFETGFTTRTSGRLEVGREVRIEYPVERLPQCRGNIGGGGPGWTITGFYSVNGGPTRMFDPTTLTADGRDRVAKPATIRLDEDGDLAIWFQVVSRWGCNAYDSDFGRNYHFVIADRS